MDEAQREARYRANRTSENHFLNMPRGLPLEPRNRSVYVQSLPVGLQVFDRIHGAIAAAERRLLTNPHEMNSHRPLSPVSMLAGQVSNLGRSTNEGNDGPFPQQGAPVEFTCGVCMTKIQKGQRQQILTCGHKFCANCFNQWHQQQGGNTTCPTCRTPVYNSRMNQQPMARAGLRIPQGRTRISSTSRFAGTQSQTPQQVAMTMFMRGMSEDVLPNVNVRRHY